ncbi:hypothetical protein PLESTM_000795600 [Pleodorina starrii]|nr:hypothetical protein PLESTM_000795600 [Pleodorina starrii]
MPKSCDPVFILDNPANNTRRRGNLEQQLSQMVLGRPGELTHDITATPALFINSRGAVKRYQVESFAAVLRHLLLLHDSARPLHVVDFGCGTGTLLLPLAVMFPHCTFTGVEMKPAAVALLLERARAAGLGNVSARRCMIEDFVETPFDVALALHACGNATDAAMMLAARRRAAYVVSPCCVGKLKFSLAGGSSFSPTVHTYTPIMPGERRATSRQAAAAEASAAAAAAGVAAPPSGLGAAGLTGSEVAATAAESGLGAAAAAVRSDSCGRGPEADEAGGGAPSGGGGGEGQLGVVTLGEIRHPRSQWMREHLPDAEAQFRFMAKVADQNHSGASAVAPGVGSRGGPEDVAAVAARLCKAHVELDRNLAAAEDGYSVGMFKCFHWQEMAKSDLLVGVPPDRMEWVGFAEKLAPCPGLESNY